MAVSPRSDKALFDGLYRWVDRCNTGSVSGLYPFKVADNTVGFVTPEVGTMLASRCAALY